MIKVGFLTLEHHIMLPRTLLILRWPPTSSTRPIHLSNVFHVPFVTQNLIFVSQLCKLTMFLLNFFLLILRWRVWAWGQEWLSSCWNNLLSEAFGLERERSKQESCLAIVDWMEFLESKALFQNPKSMSSSVLLLQLDVGLAFGGLICKDKSGCAGNSSIQTSLYLFLLLCLLLLLLSCTVLSRVDFLSPLVQFKFPFLVQLCVCVCVYI